MRLSVVLFSCSPFFARWFRFRLLSPSFFLSNPTTVLLYKNTAYFSPSRAENPSRRFFFFFFSVRTHRIFTLRLPETNVRRGWRNLRMRTKSCCERKARLLPSARAGTRPRGAVHALTVISTTITTSSTPALAPPPPRPTKLERMQTVAVVVAATGVVVTRAMASAVSAASGSGLPSLRTARCL